MSDNKSVHYAVSTAFSWPVIALVTLFISACSGGGGSSSTTTTTTPTDPQTTSLSGGGVKGPLSGAVVTAYAFDAASPGFKGAVVDTAETNSAAIIVGLEIPTPANPPYILEVTSDADTTA